MPSLTGPGQNRFQPEGPPGARARRRGRRGGRREEDPAPPEAQAALAPAPPSSPRGAFENKGGRPSIGGRAAPSNPVRTYFFFLSGCFDRHRSSKARLLSLSSTSLTLLIVSMRPWERYPAKVFPSVPFSRARAFDSASFLAAVA